MSAAHDDQVAYWAGDGGALWRARADTTDVMLAPVLAATLARAAPRQGETVLDIGCGCGASTLALADRVGPAGRVVGLDVSPPMLALATERAGGRTNVAFHLCDVARDKLDASIDLIFSRFGVMFFGDPTHAFARLRAALNPDGRLCFCCWRAPEENDWMRVPLRAAYAHAPRLPKLAPEAPGPFAFADPERVRRILLQAGFSAPAFTPLDVMLDVSGGGGLDGAVMDAVHVGPASLALADQPEAARAAAIGAIRAALAPYVSADGVRLKGAVWIVEARR